jgi:hypothetical protein
MTAVHQSAWFDRSPAARSSTIEAVTSLRSPEDQEATSQWRGALESQQKVGNVVITVAPDDV